MGSWRRRAIGIWFGTWVVLVGGQLLAGAPPLGDATWTEPTVLFWIVVVFASLCVVTSAVVLAAAHRSDAPELGVIGGFLMAASLLPLVHGITTPGVLYDMNAATMISVLLAVPSGAVIAAPLLVHRSRAGRWLLRRWRGWVGVTTGLVLVLSGLLLIRPDAIPAPAMGSPSAVGVGLLSLAGCIALSARQLRLSFIADDHRPLVLAIGFAFIGTSTLVWVGDQPYNAGFWMAHAVDISGVFGGCLGGWLIYRRTGSAAEVLRPITAVDPAAALEIGLEPVVHEFVADLDRHDRATRDHVVRTAELAICIADRLDVPAHRLRNVGLGALLHDVGKVAIPDEILNKPGRLDDDERAVMETHAAIGERMVAAVPSLRAIAPIVGSHHERWDGAGYPRRLAGADIPIEARIVSACDAFDAMAQDRVYRKGMGVEKALSILREHAGSHWDERVVEALVAEVDSLPEPPSAGVLDSVGRTADIEQHALTCGCFDAIPADLTTASPTATKVDTNV